MNFSNAKILVLGSSGQVGRAFRDYFVANKIQNIVYAERSPSTGDVLKCDLGSNESIENIVKAVQPNVIFNCAAYTAVDLAETEHEQALAINGRAVEVLAKLATKTNCILVHYSTDYVFNGSGTSPWKESDSTDPLNSYGKSKLAGENAILDLCPTFGYVFRTQWVYDNQGKNFLNTMLRLGAERETLAIVGDQVGAPTSSSVIVEFTMKSIAKIFDGSMTPGIYHLTCRGEISWHGFADEIFKLAKAKGLKLAVHELRKIVSEDFPTPAPRPKNSRLSLTKIEKALGERLPSWQTALQSVLSRRPTG